jgi:hypothetical protein
MLARARAASGASSKALNVAVRPFAGSKRYHR